MIVPPSTHVQPYKTVLVAILKYYVYSQSLWGVLIDECMPRSQVNRRNALRAQQVLWITIFPRGQALIDRPPPLVFLTNVARTTQHMYKQRSPDPLNIARKSFFDRPMHD